PARALAPRSPRPDVCVVPEIACAHLLMSDNSRVRVSIVGVVVVALFCTLLARPWFLQAGPENNLKVQAIADSTRVIQTESPRGEILDVNGNVLVKDRASWAVTVDRDLAPATAKRVLEQLQERLKIPVE